MLLLKIFYYYVQEIYNLFHLYFVPIETWVIVR